MWWEIPIRHFHLTPFSASGTAATKLPRSQAVPRLPAKPNVPDPRPLIPRRGERGRTKPYGAYASKYDQGAKTKPPPSGGVVSYLLEKRSTHALSPVPSAMRYYDTPPESQKNNSAACHSPNALTRIAPSTSSFGGFFCCQLRVRLRYSVCSAQYTQRQTQTLLQLWKLNPPWSVRPTHFQQTHPSVPPEGSLDYHSRNLPPVGAGAARQGLGAGGTTLYVTDKAPGGALSITLHVGLQTFKYGGGRLGESR